jgi:hypothetical protein
VTISHTVLTKNLTIILFEDVFMFRKEIPRSVAECYQRLGDILPPAP